MKLRFRGQHLMLLGGSCQLGQELIPLAQENGLTVHATHASPTGAQTLRRLLPETSIHHLDLGDPASVAAWAAHPLQLDYLVDLAHSTTEGLLLSLDPDQTQAQWLAMGARRQTVLQAVGRAMLARRFGRMLYVSSTAAACPAPGQGLYCALKRAIEGLYLTLGVEMAARGITTVVLRLGLAHAGRGAAFAQAHPHLPTVSPADAAALMLYLLSDQAQSIQSTLITHDSGLLAHKYPWNTK